MKVVIDRFEGKYAVCEKEDGEVTKILKSEIPIEAKEGDVLIIESDKIIIDGIETLRRREDIEKLMEDIWE